MSGSSINNYLDKAISESARKPFKNPNPYEKSSNIPFYSWMEQINDTSPQETKEIVDEKIYVNSMLDNLD